MCLFTGQEKNGWGEVILPKNFSCDLCGETFTEVQLIDKKTPNHLKKGGTDKCVFKGEVSRVKYPK